MVEIIPVPPSLVPTVWGDALQYLREPIGMSQGCYEPEDVFRFCCSADMGLWLAVEGEEVLAAYVVEIVNYPRKRRVRATFAGGKPHSMAQWLEPMVNAIEDWSKHMGCQGIEAMGRKGWTKVVDGKEIGTYICRDYPAMEMH